MARFLGGFVSASVLWAAFVAALVTGVVDINLEPDAAPAAAAPADDGVGGAPAATGKRGSRARGRRNLRFSGESQSGDELGGPDTRQLEMGSPGGEQQLRSEEIEQQFDTVLPQIRRCLILAASDEPVTGKIVFGLRIGGSTGVSKVSLRGPSAVTQTEAGECMRKAASGMRLRTFDGPDMLVQFPITLE